MIRSEGGGGEEKGVKEESAFDSRDCPLFKVCLTRHNHHAESSGALATALARPRV